MTDAIFGIALHFMHLLETCCEVRPLDTFVLAIDACGICQDTMVAPDEVDKSISKIKRCGHEFHRQCLLHWLATDDAAKTCPLCRAEIVDESNESASEFVSLLKLIVEQEETSSWVEVELDLHEEDEDFEDNGADTEDDSDEIFDLGEDEDDDDIYDAEMLELD